MSTECREDDPLWSFLDFPQVALRPQKAKIDLHIPPAHQAKSSRRQSVLARERFFDYQWPIS